QPCPETVVPRSVPPGLLSPCGDPERRELFGVVEVLEIARHGQLERASPVSLRIRLAQPAYPQRLALPYHVGGRHATRELRLELPTVGDGRGGWGDEGQSL